MRILNVALALSVILLMGCSKDCLESDCIKSELKERNMVKYEGQDVGCKFYLELFQYKNKQYFLLGNHCADMITYPTDCDGNKLCENGNDPVCSDFYANAEKMGIIGISE